MTGDLACHVSSPFSQARAKLHPRWSDPACLVVRPRKDRIGPMPSGRLVNQITEIHPGEVQPRTMSWAPSGSQRAGLAAGPSNLRILAAGIPRDERGLVEAEVRRALGSRHASEPWTVSLVKLLGKWSVTLNGPGERFRNLSFTAEEARLGAAIREAIDPERQGAAVGPTTGTAVSAPAAEVRESHTCPHCRQAMVVAYEARPPEGKESVPLACPHCWQVSRVDVGAWAAAGRDYRAEKP